MVTAGLRTTLRSTPGAVRIEATVGLRMITSPGVTQAVNQLNPLAVKGLAAYKNSTPGQGLQIRINNREVGGSDAVVNLYGAAMSEAPALRRS